MPLAIHAAAALLIAASNAGMAGGVPYSLADAARTLPEQIAATEAWLKEMGQDPTRYVVETQDCGDSKCLVHLYPAEVLELDFTSWRGCPVSICATLEIDSESALVIQATHWR